MNYLDLFSGIGGFHLGLLQAGFKFNWCGHSEIDKYAKQIYQKHFPESEDLGDVTTINVSRLPKINLVTFGFPCQDLSIAGKRRGLKGKRSGLFNEAMRIIRACRPDYFIFENVKGLFSSNNGRDFEYILREVADSGYDGGWQLLNTRWFLPQNRERIYFIGHIRGQRRPQVFPIGEGNKGIAERTSKTTNVRCLQGGGHSGGHHSAMTLIRTRSDQHYKHGRGDRTGLKVKEKSHIRRLTPTECERLQGFPDGWTEGVSDTQRYKTLGNAVSVPVVKAVAERLL